ncbi:MAG: hypothetical protein NVSMB30_31830 [Hymenobacter sp.]
MFDLTKTEPTITGSSATFKVTGWFTTYSASAGFSGSIATPTAYTASNNTTVYAQLTGNTGSCLGVASNTLTVTPSPARPNVAITEATLCGTIASPYLTVTNPEVGTTYKLTQTDKSGTVVYTKTILYSTATTTDPTYIAPVFYDLIAGKGFSIFATKGGCVSAATDCSNYLTPVGRSAPPITPTLQGFIQTEAFPNPTGQDATINFSVPKTSHVVVKVYNATGDQVATLFDGEAIGGEKESVLLKGAQLSTGTYFYKITTNGQTKTNRVSLIK